MKHHHHAGAYPERRRKRGDILILSLFSLLTLAAIAWIPRIVVDGSTEAFIPKNHQITRINDTIEEEFGSLNTIVMGVKVSFGTVVEPEVLSLIDTITQQLESIPAVDSVISPTNIDYLTSTAAGMSAVPLLEGSDPASIEEFQRRVVDWKEVYLGSVLSKNRKIAAMLIQPVAGADKDDFEEIYNQIRSISAEYQGANISFPVAGSPVVRNEIARSVSKDIAYLIPVAGFLILGVLFLSFRRIEGVAFPLLSLLMAGAWVVGLIGALGVTFTMASLLVPVLLLVVGSAYGIHVMQHFYHDLSTETGFVPYTRLCEIISKGMQNVRLPVILAGVTTAGGFISQLASPLGPFRVFGMLSALGVIASQLTSLILIPTLLRVRYRNGIDTSKFHGNASIEHRTRTKPVFVLLEKIVTKRKGSALLISTLLIAGTLYAIPGIRVGTNMLNFFRPESSLVKDAKTLNKNLGGTGIVSVVIQAPEKGKILSPSFLHSVELFSRHMQVDHDNVTGVRSIVPSIKRINAILNYDTTPYQKQEPIQASFDFFSSESAFTTAEKDSKNTPSSEVPGEAADPLSYEDLASLLKDAFLGAGTDASIGEVVENVLAQRNYHGAAFDEIPLDPAKYGLETENDLENLLSQYLVLYSGNLSMFLNDALEPDETLITVQVSREDRDVLIPLRNDIDAFWSYYLPEGWNYSIGGTATLGLVLSDLVTRSQYLSLVGSIIIVWIIVSLMFRSPIAGFMGAIPVAFAIMGIFLFMALFGFYLDIITSLLAALAVGIGVDYAIHYMSAYRIALRNGEKNPLNAVYRTTGSAIFFNAMSVAIGFLGLLISQFIPIRQLGILFSVSMLFACGASLILLPMALEYFKPSFLFKTTYVTKKENNK